MKKTTKIISLALSFCMVLALGIIGVLAVQNLNLEIGGNISFTAEGVKATITKGDENGENVVTGGTVVETGKMEVFAIDTSKTESEWQNSSKAQSWKNLQFTFGDTGTTTFKFTVKNDQPTTSTNEYLLVTTAATPGEWSNAEIAITRAKLLAPQQSTTVEVTFTVQDTDTNASMTGFNIELGLERVDATQIQSSHTGMSFTPISGKIGEASVEGATGVTANLEIPSVVSISSSNYVVTEIADR